MTSPAPGGMTMGSGTEAGALGGAAAVARGERGGGGGGDHGGGDQGEAEDLHGGNPRACRGGGHRPAGRTGVLRSEDPGSMLARRGSRDARRRARALAVAAAAPRLGGGRRLGAGGRVLRG